MNWKTLQQGLVIFLLFCMVVFQAIQIVGDYQAKRQCQTALEGFQNMIEIQKTGYLDLMQTYQKAAYEDTRVERIAEQQLLASESQLSALQVMASQNGVLIDLLAACQ
jgi:cell division protein FtsL